MTLVAGSSSSCDSNQSPVPDVSWFIPEDGALADHLFSEQQQCLLPEPVYARWTVAEGRPSFLAADRGGFATPCNDLLGLDLFLALDTASRPPRSKKRNRS